MTKLSHLAWRIGLLALASVVASPARGEILLQQPPKEVVFRLGTPSSGSVDLLLPFRDTSVDRLGPVRLYTSGPWGRWQREPLLQLSWQTPPRTDSLELGPVAPSRELGLEVEPPLAPLQGAPTSSIDLTDLLLVRDRAWTARYSFATAPTFDTTGFGDASYTDPCVPDVDLGGDPAAVTTGYEF